MDNGISSAELYIPASNTWRAGPAMESARIEHRAVRLVDGRVLEGCTLALLQLDPLTAQSGSLSLIHI